MSKNTIEVTDLSLEYIQEIADSIESKGFSNTIRVKEAVTYICERAAWLNENKDNLYVYKEIDSEIKLIKVNIK